jgi:hypothetical protein
MQRSHRVGVLRSGAQLEDRVAEVNRGELGSDECRDSRRCDVATEHSAELFEVFFRLPPLAQRCRAHKPASFRWRRPGFEGHLV